MKIQCQKVADWFYKKSGGSMSKKKDKEVEPAKPKIDATIVVALIGAIVTITVALINRLPSSPTATPVSPSPLSPTNTTQPETVIPNPTFTETLTFTSTPTETFTPTITLTPIPPTLTFTSIPGLPIGMQVIVVANPPSGKKPLKVNIDARGSFLRAANGDIFECKHGACSYTWYLTIPGGQSVKQPEKDGYIDFTFEKKGSYYINVYVCQGSDVANCASGGTTVIVE